MGSVGNIDFAVAVGVSYGKLFFFLIIINILFNYNLLIPFPL